MSAPGIWTVLLVGSAAMALLALVYLLQRRLEWWQLCAWGALAFGLPILGPFLVLCLRPRPLNTRRRALTLRLGRAINSNRPDRLA